MSTSSSESESSDNEVPVKEEVNAESDSESSDSDVPEEEVKKVPAVAQVKKEVVSPPPPPAAPTPKEAEDSEAESSDEETEVVAPPPKVAVVKKSENIKKPESKKPKTEQPEKEPKPAKKAETQEQKKPQQQQKNQNGSAQHRWLPKDQAALVQLLVDDVHAGTDVRKPKNDPYWEGLTDRLNEKLEMKYSKNQVADKVNRLKQKFERDEKGTPAPKKPDQQKTEHQKSEEALQALMKEVWGASPTPTKEPNTKKDTSKKNTNTKKDTKEPATKKDTKPKAAPTPTLVPTPTPKWIESSDGMETSEPPVRKLDLVPAAGASLEVGDGVLAEMARVFMAKQQIQDPVFSFSFPAPASNLSGVVNNGSLSKNVKKRMLEDKLDEYSTMTKKVKLTMQCVVDCYALEQDKIKKHLESL